MFAGHNKIFASGVVTYKFRNKDLAAELWDYDNKGQTWEYLYFLDEIQEQNISYKDFNKAVGYEQNNIIRGLNVLDEDKSQKALNTLGITSDIYLPDISQQEFEKAIDELEGKDSLEVQGTAQVRIEQGFLRNSLFGKHTVFKCGICNKKHPVSFLIAAHIKKRAACDIKEKKDFKSVVIPMCIFGCDALYERGYIAVKDGKVVDLHKKLVTPAITQYLKTIVNNNCDYWNEQTAPYFQWHFDFHAQTS